MNTEDTSRREKFIAGLRACADFLEAHPAVKAPRYITMNVFVNTREELVDQAKAATWVKEYADRWFALRKSFGDDLSIDITAERELVCRRVVTGTRIEPAKPAHEVEEVTWECTDPVLA